MANMALMQGCHTCPYFSILYVHLGSVPHMSREMQGTENWLFRGYICNFQHSGKVCLCKMNCCIQGVWVFFFFKADVVETCFSGRKVSSIEFVIKGHFGGMLFFFPV